MNQGKYKRMTYASNDKAVWEDETYFEKDDVVKVRKLKQPKTFYDSDVTYWYSASTKRGLTLYVTEDWIKKNLKEE